MNLSRHTCGACGEPEALFVGSLSRCCNWALPHVSAPLAMFNSERHQGRPPKLSDEKRREMRVLRASGWPIKTIAARAGMSISQTRVICRDAAPVPEAQPT